MSDRQDRVNSQTRVNKESLEFLAQQQAELDAYNNGPQGLRPAAPGTSIWSQFYSTVPTATAQHPFVAPDGQTYYSETPQPSGGLGYDPSKGYGTEPLWLDAQGNPTPSYLNDQGQMMQRVPGWGQGAVQDPRYGASVPYNDYKTWYKDQQDTTLGKLGGFMPAIFGAAVGGIGAAHALSGAGAAAGAGAAGTTMGPSGLLETGFLGAEGMGGSATAAGLMGDGVYTVAPLLEGGGTGAAWGAGEGTFGAATGGVGGMEGFAGPLADAGGDTMLNAFGGPGSALTPSSSGGFWSDVLTKGSVAGMDIGRAGMALASLFAGKAHANDLKAIAEQAAARSDPAAHLRPFFQEQTVQSFANPDYFKNSPVLGGINNLAMDEVSRNMSSRGYNMSGNERQAMGSRLQDESMKYAQQQQSMMGQFAGLTANPSYAGLNFGNLASQGAQQNANAIGNFGVLADEIRKGLPQLANMFNNNTGGGGLV